MENFIGTINPHRNSERFFTEHSVIDAKLINTLKRGVKAAKQFVDIRPSDDSTEYFNYLSFLLKVAKQFNHENKSERL